MYNLKLLELVYNGATPHTVKVWNSIPTDIRSLPFNTFTKSTFFRTINEEVFSPPNWTQIQSYTNVESIKNDVSKPDDDDYACS